jgi:adsorption protein B
LFRGVFDFIGGHYADEFAESHRRDLMVREALTNGIPSAGVGCAFSDQALRHIAKTQHNGPFNENSVTEDYDLATRIHQLGFPQAFVRLPEVRKDHKRACICSKALFPDELSASVRQKARWLIGIAFQGRDEFQWSGNIFQRYMFFRDRKAIITAPLTFAAYFLLLNAIILTVAPYLWRDFPGFGALVNNRLWLSTILSLNVFFLSLRVAQRIWHVGAIYGFSHAIMSVFRIPVGNLINFLATIRAFRLYHRARREGRPLVWDKTDHSFPNALLPSGQVIVPGE